MDKRTIVKATLSTKIKVGDKKSLTTIPFFGKSSVEVKRKILLHMEGLGIDFTDDELSHFTRFGYLLIDHHQIEFKVTFFHTN